MWYDARDGQCRGSLVQREGQVVPGLLNVPACGDARVAFQTWANHKPVAKTIAVTPARRNTALRGVSASGGGVRSMARRSTRATRRIQLHSPPRRITAADLKGAKQDAIPSIPPPRGCHRGHDIITGAARATAAPGAGHDSAIRGVCSSQTRVRITIQPNRIHDRATAPPAGPTAIPPARGRGVEPLRGRS